MPKVVLIMDMPEQVCQKCTLCHETENDDEYLCCATGKLLSDGEKPDWCPLRELPERMEICGTYAEYYAKGGLMPSYKLGWNKCLDAIEGDADKTDD